MKLIPATLLLAGSLSVCSPATAGGSVKPGWMAASVERMTARLTTAYGPEAGARAERGLKQVADFWREEDGNSEVFEEFMLAHFAVDQAALDTMFGRFEDLFEALDGHMLEIIRELRQQVDLDYGPIQPYDEIFAAYDPSAHMADDLFRNKIAFVVLLNFPVTTLEQRLSEGEHWTRREWAEARLVQRFARRVPAEVNQALSEAGAAADQYIAQYNIWMHHLVTGDGERLFPPGLRLLSHWNLRDEIKASYSLADQGLAIRKQQMIQKVMERIVTQTIPAQVVDNPHVDWDPFSNKVTLASVTDSDLKPLPGLEPDNAREPDTRYQVLLDTYRAARMVDPYSPSAPSLIARRFDEDREIPETRVRAMLEEVVSSPLAVQVALLIESRLGRPLEPFDIWYNGFKARGAYTEENLDRIVAEKYPTATAYWEDIPNQLMKLGFSEPKAIFLAGHIVVDPARGSGHAWGAAMRSAKAHLRTRVEKSGMNYKGYNIAVHELGHNVEQVFSLNEIDHVLLQGVPNTAFTEALAFVFQARDLELLGLSTPDAASRALETLNDFWGTYEIAGVALVDMAVWHWMYDHPEATAAELREATITIARDTWNRYYAPVFGLRDVDLLGIYSHMIHSFLYLPDYPIGHLIAHQIEEQVETSGNLGAEFERMSRYGALVPDLWMIHATGKPVGSEALLHATENALREIP